MWCARYWAPRYWAPRYWAKVGAAAAAGTTRALYRRSAFVRQKGRAV
jgi:hypothetical protein